MIVVIDYELSSESVCSRGRSAKAGCRLNSETPAAIPRPILVLVLPSAATISPTSATRCSRGRTRCSGAVASTGASCSAAPSSSRRWMCALTTWTRVMRSLPAFRRSSGVASNATTASVASRSASSGSRRARCASDHKDAARSREHVNGPPISSAGSAASAASRASARAARAGSCRRSRARSSACALARNVRAVPVA